MTTDKTQTKLTKEQTHAVALLSIGVFLEDFDRMLHGHISVIINDLFFPQKSSFIKEFLPAFSFSSTYFLSPVGALFFGYLGDIFGRRSTIIVSSLLISACCLTFAFLPTYEQIGVTASILFIFCRMIQGMSGAAEVTGVEIYLSESLKPPLQYPVVALVASFGRLGSFIALCMAYICTNTMVLNNWSGNSWRLAFLIGSVIGMVGNVARSSLKEATEFSDKQKLLKEAFKKADIKWSKKNPSINPKVPFATCLAYFFICCARPLCFYLMLFHCGEILRNEFKYTPTQIVDNNMLPAILNLLISLLVAYCSYKIRPLWIIKFKLVTFLVSLVLFIVAFYQWHTPKTLILFQCIWATFRFDYTPAAPIFFKYFPALKRFRYTSLIRSVAITFSYTTTSFLLAYATKQLGQSGILLIFIPFSICFAWGIYYFEQREQMQKR
jgi:MHS family proline/betaine transporter-like MFS transporter